MVNTIPCKSFGSRVSILEFGVEHPAHCLPRVSRCVFVLGACLAKQKPLMHENTYELVYLARRSQFCKNCKLCNMISVRVLVRCFARVVSALLVS